MRQSSTISAGIWMFTPTEDLERAGIESIEQALIDKKATSEAVFEQYQEAKAKFDEQKRKLRRYEMEGEDENVKELIGERNSLYDRFLKITRRNPRNEAGQLHSQAKRSRSWFGNWW